MTSVVFVAPYIPPLPPAPSWVNLRHTWVGWDGSTWDLSDYYGGVFLGRGVQGLAMPSIQRFSSESAAVDGSRHRGSRAQAREVRWPIHVWSDQSSEEWLDLDAAFWRTMDPDREGVWTVQRANGSARSLRLRFVEDGSHARGIDPAYRGWDLYAITLQADDPYWAGEPVSRLFAASSPEDFFPGPPFTITEGSLLSSARIANLGDVPSWPTWWVTGSESAAVGVGDRQVEIPFEVAAGRLLVVDTRPEARTAVEVDAPPAGLSFPQQREWVTAALPGGANRTRELGAGTKFGPVPPGAEAALAVEMVGTQAQARATLTPKYRRPW